MDTGQCAPTGRAETYHIHDIDIAEVRIEQGKLHNFVAIDGTSKFAFVELHRLDAIIASLTLWRRWRKSLPS